MTLDASFARDPAMIAGAKRDLSRTSRAHIPGFLDGAYARDLLRAMQALDWRIVLNRADKTYDLDRLRLAALDLASREELAELVNDAASDEFQFLYDAFRLSDEVEAGRFTQGPLAEFYHTLNSEPVLAHFRELTGEPSIAYADIMASRYRPGHFLTHHTDEQPGGHRLFAYVFNLTPFWRPDWGGLLMFTNEQGQIDQAFSPRFGALNLLRVPQPHCVTMVSSFARGARYSLTGWFRSDRPSASV